MMTTQDLSLKVDQILDTKAETTDKLKAICEAIHSYDHKYSWVGFYIMHHPTKMLHLGPFVGESTDHTVIPFGKGICGQVAVSGETYLAEDVSSESNYIACSLNVKSEIVIPVYDGEKLVAQLDIDSTEKDAFNEAESQVLHSICKRINTSLGAEMHFEEIFTQSEG